MDKLIVGNDIYEYYKYQYEDNFEKKIVSQSKNIFGENSIYIDIKKRIGKGILSIPDGYLLDFTFPENPALFLIENELSHHDTFRHIAPQMIKFAQSFNEYKYELKQILKKSILSSSNYKKTTEGLIKLSSRFTNLDEVLDSVIFKTKFPAIIIVIDDISTELEEALSLVTLKTDILSFKTYKSKNKEIHLYTPFNNELREIAKEKKSKEKIENIDTIVVPARADGFNEVFVGANCWYAIKMSSTMIDKIKYIAAYQISPVSAITCYAEVLKIEKYTVENKHETDTWSYVNQNKYIIYFKSKAKKINPLKLNKFSPLQSPRYTNFKRLIKAKELKDVF